MMRMVTGYKEEWRKFIQEWLPNRSNLDWPLSLSFPVMGQTRITDDIYDMVQTECSRIGLRRTVEDLREARMAAFRKERFRGSLES